MGNAISKRKEERILALLAKGESIRGVERITGVHRDTIMRLKNLGPVSERKTKALPYKRESIPLNLPRPVLAEYKRLAKVANSNVWYAVESGKLANPSTACCADCGVQAECYDHRDYLKPLSVEPVCKKCNSSRGMATDTFINHRDYWLKFNWIVETETRIIAIRRTTK